MDASSSLFYFKFCRNLKQSHETIIEKHENDQLFFFGIHIHYSFNPCSSVSLV